MSTAEMIIKILDLSLTAFLLLLLYFGVKEVFLPFIKEFMPAFLRTQEQAAKSMSEMALAVTRVVDTGANLKEAAVSMMETAKGMQANAEAMGQMAQIARTLLEQNATDHQTIITLLRASNATIAALPCQELKPGYCPDTIERT